MEVFGLRKLAQADIADKVEYLLHNDRFICRADGREVVLHVLRRFEYPMKLIRAQKNERHFRATEITEIIFCKYFARVKMRGHFDDTFFDSIN